MKNSANHSDVEQRGSRVRVRKRRRRQSNASINEVQNRVTHGKGRRRRSRQVVDRESSQEVRRWQFRGILTVFLLGFFLLLAGSFSIGYHNSRSYRTKLLGQIAKSSGSSVSVESLKISPTQANARVVNLEWPGDVRLLESLTLQRVSANYIIGGLLGGSWGNATLSAEEGLLLLNLEGERDSAVNEASSFTETESISCRNFSIQLKGDPEPFVISTNANYRWSGEPNKLLLTGGKMNSDLLEGFSLEQGFFRFKKKGVEISLRLEEDAGKGAVSLEGGYKTSETARMSFQLKAEKLKGQFLLGEKLGDLFRGQYNSKHGELEINREEGTSMTYSMECASTDIELGRFDCFSVLAESLSKSWYRRPRFTDGGHFLVTQMKGATSITNLQLIKEGALVVTGFIKEGLKGGLDGEFKIGIPSKYLPQLDRTFKKGTFSEIQNGYVWTAVKITGDQTSLKDDLRSKLYGRSELQPVRVAKPNQFKYQRKLPETQEELEDAFDELISK